MLFNYIYFNTTSDPWLPVDNSTVIASLNTPRDGPWIYNPKITAWLQDFAVQVRNYSSTYGYNGQDCENDNLWEFFSALLFTVSIVTTVGKGNLRYCLYLSSNFNKNIFFKDMDILRYNQKLKNLLFCKLILIDNFSNSRKLGKDKSCAFVTPL